MKPAANQYGKRLKTPTYLSVSINPIFPLLMEKQWSTEATWIPFPPLLVAHPPPPPRLAFQKSMTGPPICITTLPCGPRLRRKGFYAGLAWLAWQMHYALSAQTHTYVDVHIPADHSTPICSVSKEKWASTAGLSGLSDAILWVSLTSSL